MNAIASDRHRALQGLVGTIDTAAAAGASHWSNRYFEKQRPMAEIARSGELSAGISEVLDNRVVAQLKLGTKKRTFLKSVLELGSLSTLSEDKPFMKYLRSVSVTFCNSGGLSNGTGPELALAMFGHAVAEFELIREAQVPKSIAGYNAWNYGPFKLSEMAQKADELFGTNSETSKVKAMAMVLVARKTYETIEQAKDEYVRILEEAKAIFGSDPGTEGLVRTAAYLVWTKKYESVKTAFDAYLELLKDAKSIFGQDEETKGIICTVVGQVFKNHYRSISHARSVWIQLSKEAKTIFGSDPETDEVVRNAVHLVFKNVYKNLRKAKSVLESITEKSEEVFGSNPETKDLVGTATSLVWNRQYASVQVAFDIYMAIRREVEEVFGSSKQAKKIARMAAHLVFTNKYPTVKSCFDAYNGLLKDAAMAFSDFEEKKIVKTVASMVWNKSYSSIGAVREAYDILRKRIGDALFYRGQHEPYSAFVLCNLLKEKAHLWEEKDIWVRVQELKLAFNLHHRITFPVQDFDQAEEIQIESLPEANVSLAPRSAAKPSRQWQPSDVFEEFEHLSRRKFLHEAISRLGIAQRYTIQQFFEGERNSIPDDVFLELKAAMDAVMGKEGGE